jgi:plasmid stabilization system protein ParE
MKIAGFHPEARAELDAAVAWYEDQRPGLGRQLLAAVREAFDRIASNPATWPRATPRSQQYRLKRFPYRVVYQVRAEQIVILAIMHVRRSPGYWRRREPAE